MDLIRAAQSIQEETCRYMLEEARSSKNPPPIHTCLGIFDDKYLHGYM